MPETPRGIWYPSDEADANVPADMKKQAEGVDGLLGEIDLADLVVPGGSGDKGKVPMVDNAGVVALRALKGDVSVLSTDGTIGIGDGRVLTKMLGDKAVSTAKVDDGAITEGKASLAVQAKLNNERVPVDGSATSRKIKPTIGTKTASGNLVTEEAYADVPGLALEITPQVASNLMLWTSIYAASITSSPTLTGIVSVDGEGAATSEARGPLTHKANVPLAEGPVLIATGLHVIPLSATAHTVKIRFKRTSTGSQAATLSTASRMLYQLCAS